MLAKLSKNKISVYALKLKTHTHTYIGVVLKMVKNCSKRLRSSR
jgi:hypothetical protein